MKFANSKILAVGAVAIGLSLTAGNVFAAAYELDSGTAIPVSVTATVDQSSDVTVTRPINFGTIGIKQDATDTATVTLDPTSSAVSEDLAGAARIVTDSSATAPTAGIITVTGAFPDTDIHVVYRNPVNLTCALCAIGNPNLALTEVRDNMVLAAALTLGTGVQQGALSTSTEGIGTTTPAGLLTFGLGATITTIAGATPYASGAYVGSVEMLLSY